MNFVEIREKMQAAIDHFSGQIVGIRGGAISAGVVDTVKITQFGQMVPIQHLAITSNEKGKIVIRPHNPADSSVIVAALKQAGFDAYIFAKGTVVVNRPPPSGEDRKKVEILIRKLAEDARISIRNIRKGCKQKMADLSADEKKKAEKQLQDITDNAINLVDEIVQDKLKVVL